MKGNEMKMLAVVISLAVCLCGCTTLDKIDVIDQDVDQGYVQGMTEENKFAYSIPNFHKGPYTGIDDVNVKVIEGPYKGMNATFFLGKSRENGEWEVFFVMIMKQDGKWKSLPVKLTE